MAVVLGTNSGFVLASPSVDPAGTQSAEWDGYLFAQSFVTPASPPVVVTEIGWWQDWVIHAACAWECAIYTNNATPTPDEPGTVVGSISTGMTVANNATGWQTKTGLSISLSASTTYWIAIGMAQVTGTIDMNRATDTGNFAGYTTDTAGTLDSTWTGTFTVAYADRNYAVYAKYGTLTIYASECVGNDGMLV